MFTRTSKKHNIMNTKCIYTFIIGEYDYLKNPKIITPDWDYICVTDNPNLKSDIWKIIQIDKEDQDIQPLKRRAMSLMIGYQKYLPKHYDVVITIGGQCIIHTDLNKCLEKHKYSNEVDACFIIHPNRNCVYDEGNTVVQVGRDTKENIHKHLKKYKDNNYPRKNGLYASGAMILNNNSKKTQEFFNLWLDEYKMSPSIRDQMSFNYSLWRYEKESNKKLNINEIKWVDIFEGTDFSTTSHLKPHKSAMKNSNVINLEHKVNELYQTPSDINEHLPTLIKYGQECNHITEMGVRGIISTWAFLGSAPDKMISYDIQDPKEWAQNINEVYETAKAYNLDFTFTQANVLEVEIEPTELLFIDTWHAYKQLKAELDLHADKASKYIILHDTTSFEFRDETSYEIWGEEWVGDGKGLWPAVEEFLEANPHWILHERFFNNNGLTILKRLNG